MKHTLSLLILLSLTFGQVTGIVIDRETRKPLKNVNITSQKSGATTDDHGQFSIAAESGDTLVFAHIGYKSLTLPAEMGMEVQMEKTILQGKEITVHGELRDVAHQKSTSGVSVLDEEKIRIADGNHFQDVMESIPNLNTAGGTSRPRYFQIRGIGEQSQYFAEGPPNFSVGFVMDNIDLSGLGMAGMLYDLHQIEVFKGPQSAVYGPNALSGLINLESSVPQNAWSSQLKLTGGTDHIHRLNGMVNIPMGNMFALRVGFESGEGDGFRKNQYRNRTDTNGRNENFIREKLLFKPNENLNMTLTAFRAVLDNKYDAWAPDNNEELFTYTNDQGFDKQETNAYAFRTNYQRNKMNATFIISRSLTDQIHAYDSDWGNDDYWLESPYYFDPNITYWNYEFFDSTTRNRENHTIEGRVKYGDVVLGYYTKSLIEKDEASGWLYGGNATLATSQYDFAVSAIYAQIDRSITDKLKLLVNIRKETNRINYLGTSSYFDWTDYILVPMAKIEFNVEHDLLGGKLALQYLLNDRINFYGSVSRGYKAGGVNQHPALAEENRPYAPEYMNNFEACLRWHAEKSYLYLTTFYAFRQDQQVSISGQQQEGDPNSFVYYTANATSGKSGGLELEGSFRLNSQIVLRGALGLLNTRVDAFAFESDSGVTTTLGNRNGAHAPKYSFNFALDYGKENNGFFGQVEWSGKDRFYFSDSHDEMSEPYQLINGHIGYDFGFWSVKLWGRNILDARYATRGFYFGLEPIWNEDLQQHEYPERKYVSYGDPAHFGLTVDFEFE